MANSFVKAAWNQGNSPATTAKKLRHLKRLFQLAVERKQLEENPLRHVKPPKSPKKKVEIFSTEECRRILKAARDSQTETSVRWELLVAMALTTGMRRGELLNTVWADLDFAGKTISVSPKKDTAETWEWHIKDTDRRKLPLAEDVVVLQSTKSDSQTDTLMCLYQLFDMPTFSESDGRTNGRFKAAVAQSTTLHGSLEKF